MADNGERSPRFDGYGNAFEHGAIVFAIGETDIAILDATTYFLEHNAARVDFVGLINYFEQALASSDTALNDGIDVGDAAHRLQRQHHGTEERDKLARRQIAFKRFAACHVDHARDAKAEYDLCRSHAKRSHANQLQILLLVAAVDFIEPFGLVLITAEYLDDPVATDDFLGHLHNLADRILDTAAVATEGSSEYAHDHGHDGNDNSNE
jgi:hypothetical protein